MQTLNYNVTKDEVNRNMHLFTIFEKSQINYILQFAQLPYGIISAPRAAYMMDIELFLGLCQQIPPQIPKIFDCGTHKGAALKATNFAPTHLIYNGNSQQFQDYAQQYRIILLKQRPPAFMFSLNEKNWHHEIKTWQANKIAIVLENYRD